MTDTALDDAATSRSTRCEDLEHCRFTCIICSGLPRMCDHCDRAYARHVRLGRPDFDVADLHNEPLRPAEVIPLPVPAAHAMAEELAENFSGYEPSALPEGDDLDSYRFGRWEIDRAGDLLIATRVGSPLIIALPVSAGPIEPYLEEL